LVRRAEPRIPPTPPTAGGEFKGWNSVPNPHP
jgi:hypothetical protein